MQRKTIVITGSTRGIGYGLATEFLKAGQQVVINGRSPEKVSEAVDKLNKIAPFVVGVAGDVHNEATHRQLIEKAVATFGSIDVWINNAGIPQPRRSFLDIDPKDIQAITEINIYGLMLGTRTAANFMMQQGFGKIFNMEGFGSDGRMMKKLSLYGTTKRAVHYFSKSVSAELEGTPVQLGILSPGMVRTDFLKNDEPGTPQEEKQFNKVYKILAEDADVVTQFLVAGILKSTKHYDRIEFLSGWRLASKLLRLMVS
jgi:NAD(P)-dependent dehydrogenase (short-subunit alcohol dehydrogenase family)